MARTRDPAAHAIRRDAFIDAAERQIQLRGYGQLSIQDILDEVGASKGAFYHYFDSKAALLDGVVERMVDGGVERFGPAMSDPDMPALEKFECFFGGIAEYKAERRDLIFGFMQVWLSDDNAVVRERFRRGLVGRLEPLMTGIIRQGVAEGVFRVSSPETVARVLVAIIQGLNEDATSLFLALGDGSISLEQVEGRIAAYLEAFERILGARPGSVKLADASLLRDWHRWQQTYRKDHP